MRAVEWLEHASFVLGPVLLAVTYAAALVALAPAWPLLPVAGAAAGAALVAWRAFRPFRYAHELESFAHGKSSFLRYVDRGGYVSWDRDEVPHLLARIVRLELASLLMLVVLFGVLLWGYARVDPAAFSAGGDLAFWGLYAVDSVAEGLLLDLPAVYDVHLVRVEPESFWARTAVFALRATVSLLAVNGLVTFLRLRRRVGALLGERRRPA